MRRLTVLIGALVILLALTLQGNSFANQPHATTRPMGQPSAPQSQMFQLLQNLSQEFSIDHTVHWKHSVPHLGDVTTSMSLAPTNFDGCSVVWSQTQEGTRPGQLFYIETHRFEVPLSSIDPTAISVEPVAAGQSQRPGIEPGDYSTILLHAVGGKKTVNMVDHNITFDQKRGPIATVQRLMVSSAWVRVRQPEQGETLKTQFQQAIASCVAAGQ
jgi:hypothetical protein